MRYSKGIHVALLMACVGCAGTQSGAAFTIRPPARDPGPPPPDLAAVHEENLRHALDRAAEKQEAEDGLLLHCHARKFEDKYPNLLQTQFTVIQVCD